MFEIKQEFLGTAYGNEIHTTGLYWALYNTFYCIVDHYEDIKFNEQALCTDLLFAIKQCWHKTDLSLSEITEELIACVDEETSLNELKLHVYGVPKFFEELNDNFANGTYIIKE